MPTSSADLPENALLRLEHLNAGYGSDFVIRDINLHIQRGEVVSVVGPNGAGKSTVLKACVGALPRIDGSIQLDGRDILGVATEDLTGRGLGYVPQLRDVFRRLTVRENIEIGAYTFPKAVVKERLQEILDQFPSLAGMQDRRAGFLSGGERKIVAIARALIAKPHVLLLDEPTAGLSPKLASQFLETQLPALAGRGVAVLLVEQRARQALLVSDRAYILAGGEVRLVDTSERLLARSDLGDVFLGVLPTTTER